MNKNHSWKQILSEFTASGLGKRSFLTQYNSAHPTDKLCPTTFYRKVAQFQKMLDSAEQYQLIQETDIPEDNQNQDSVEIVEILPQPIEQPSKDNCSQRQFDTLVVKAPGGVSITLATENGIAALSVLVNSIIRASK